MSAIIKLINSEEHICFDNIEDFLKDLKDGLHYASDEEFIGPGDDNLIKITIELKNAPKLYCYLNNYKRTEARPQINITSERFDEIIKEFMN